MISLQCLAYRLPKTLNELLDFNHPQTQGEQPQDTGSSSL